MQNLEALARKLVELWLFQIPTSEVEVEAGVKIKVRYILGLSRCTTMQNLEALARKLVELWLFKNFDL